MLTIYGVSIILCFIKILYGSRNFFFFNQITSSCLRGLWSWVLWYWLSWAGGGKSDYLKGRWFKCFANLVNNCRDDVIFDETVQVVSFVCSNEALYLQTCNAFSTSFLAKSACPCVLSSIVHDMFHWLVYAAKNCPFVRHKKKRYMYIITHLLDQETVLKSWHDQFLNKTIVKQKLTFLLYTSKSRTYQGKFVKHKLPVHKELQVLSLLIAL